MAQAFLPLQIASSAMTVLGQVRQGKQAKSEARAQAALQEQRANEQRAAGQRQAALARRNAGIVQSNALARIAAGGGGGDPTAETTLSRIAGQGEFNAMNVMADSESQARLGEYQASFSRYRGKNAQRNANFGALSDGLSFAGKYGGQIASLYK